MLKKKNTLFQKKSDIYNLVIVDKCEKALESDITIKKDIFDKIEQQLSSVSLFREKIEKTKKYTILS